MYKLCKTEQSAKRQKLLEEGLLGAMLVRSYGDISISDLCDRLQIPRKSFYRYFTGKDGALYALIDHRIMGIGAHSQDGGGELRDFFEYWMGQKPLLDALARNNFSGLLVQRAMSQEEPFLPFDLRHYPAYVRQQATAFAVCGMMSLVLRWHHGGYRESPKEMAQMCRRILGTPLMPGLRM